MPKNGLFFKPSATASPKPDFCKAAMQSGIARTKEWVLVYPAADAREIDPLMGWISNADTNPQVRMTFETREEAIDFARRQNIPFQVTEPREAMTLP